MSEPDNIYYNIRINGEKDKQKIAEFNSTRVESILDNPSDYEMTIQRFSVPAFNLPVLLWKDNKWYITLSYGGTDITYAVDWIPVDATPAVYGRSVYSYQHFLDMVNATFIKCFNDLKLAHPAAPPTEAPFITYDATTELFIMNTEKLYNETDAGAPTIEIWFNFALGSLFVAFQQFYDNIDQFKSGRLIIKNNYNNSATINAKPYYSTKAEYSTLYLFNDLKSIVFQTNSIPVIPENNSGQKNLTQQILTDFEPLASVNNRTAFQYFPRGALRWYNLDSNYPLRNIDMRVYWTDKQDKLYPIYIFQNEALTIKLNFRKKLR